MLSRFGLWTVVAALFLAPAANSQEAPPSTIRPLLRIDAKTPQGLQGILKHGGQPLRLVSGHRGGALAGYPENCIATFEHTLAHTFALLEVDPRMAKDGAIVIHHDPTLERTTTGRGRVADFTLAELKQLKLKDPAGKVTEHPIPTLDEALAWARGKAVLVLDQKDVSVAARMKKIEEHKAEAYAMLIVYSFALAKEAYQLNPNVMLEVMIPNLAKVAEFDATGVPWRNVVAFVGHVPPTDPELYKAIHQRGAACMVGTSRNLDRQFLSGQVKDIKQLEPGYRGLLTRGADLFETDIPAQLGPLLFGDEFKKPPASEYFHVK